MTSPRTTHWIAAIALTMLAQTAHATEDDRNAGICAAYLTLLKKDRAVTLALAMADKPARAETIGVQWIRDAQRLKTPMAAATEGDGACKKIGIRPLDY